MSESDLVFPSWRYHQDEPEGRIIHSKKEHEATKAKGWVMSPADFKKEEPKKEIKPTPKG